MFAILLLYLLAVLFNFKPCICIVFFVHYCVAAICWCQLLLPNANDYQ